MAELSDKIRIKDIAELAGVSKGTVDRVIHNRGEVSEASRKKVEKVLQEMNYKPNVYASALASKKRYHFLCILPEHGADDYWAQVEAGIKKQMAELRDLNVTVDLHYYDQYDVYACRELYEKVPGMQPDAVLMAPLFKDSSEKLARKLEEQHIPFVFVDSQVEGVEPLAYYGMHSFKSGHLAAKLLFHEHPEIESAVMFHAVRRGETGANQTVQRKAGFMEYIRCHRPGCVLHSVGLHWNNKEENDRILTRFFEEHPEVKAGVTFNSRVFMIADYLQRNASREFRLLGYDLLGQNVTFLKSGEIEYLIAQRPEIQGYRGVKALADHLIFKQEVSAVNYMPMDILTDENMEFYLNFPSI
ncbi:MAG: substrate-binding domain-containing protein [Bacteroidales bacterium]